jgi:hypothetical protein
MRRLVAALVLAAAVTAVRAQRPPVLPADTLAVVGPQVITARDFIERFELMPWPGKDRAGMRDSAKIYALRSLVAEKLLAAEANARGVQPDSATLLRRDALERMLVRDELYRREVVARATVSPEEMRKGLQRYPVRVSVMFLRTASLEDARTLFRLLREPRPKGAPVREIPRGLVLTADSLEVIFGGDDWTLEDSAYGLTSARPISGGFLTDQHGWGVLSLNRRSANPAAGRDPRNDVEKILLRRARENRAADYTRSALAGVRAEADPATFNTVADALHARLAADPRSHFKTNGFEFAAGDLLAAASALQPVSEKVLVAIPSGDITVSRMLDHLRDHELRFSSLDTTAFKNELNSHFRSVVRAELLSREAMRQGLQHSDPVTRDLNTWTDTWRSATLEQQTRRSVSVTETDAIEFLIRHAGVWGDSYEVNVREILSDSLAASLQLLDSLNSGADMASLARRHSRRQGWAARGGESGFFYVSSLPEIGVPALYLDSGAVGGPYRHSRGQSIITRIALRRGKNAMDLDSLRWGARTGARAEKAQQAVTAEVARLAREAGVTMYYDRLVRVKTTPSNMVTKRSIGFGGVMMAVPSIRPNWQWTKETPNVREVLP